MRNPILQAISGRAQKSNNLLGVLASLKSGNPDAIYQQMMQTNTQFAQFVNDNKGKSPDQIARENNVDMGLFHNLIK